MSLTVDGQDFREPVYWLNKVNLKTYTDRTGAQLAALSNIQLGKIYRCNTTGNGFVLNNYYMRDAADSKWVIVYAAAGFQSVFAAAQSTGIFWGSYYPRKLQFINVTSTGGTLTDDDTGGGVNVETNGSTDGRATLMFDIKSAKVDWSKPAVMRWKMQLDDAKQMIARIGFHVTALATTSSNTDKQVGLEIDQVPDTDTFWSIISSDGTTKSTLLTPSNPVSQSNTYRYTLEYIPNVAINLSENGKLIATKTTHLPNTGSSTTNDVWQVGVRTRHANGKNLDLRSIAIAFHNADVY